MITSKSLIVLATFSVGLTACATQTTDTLRTVTIQGKKYFLNEKEVYDPVLDTHEYTYSLNVEGHPIICYDSSAACIEEAKEFLKKSKAANTTGTNPSTPTEGTNDSQGD